MKKKNYTLMVVSKSNALHCTWSSVRCTFEAFLVLHQTSVCDINQHQHQFQFTQYHLKRSTWQKYATLLYSYYSFTHLTSEDGNFLVTSSILVVFLLLGVQFRPPPPFSALKSRNPPWIGVGDISMKNYRKPINRYFWNYRQLIDIEKLSISKNASNFSR